MPIYQLAVDDNAAAHARAQRNHDEIAHPPGRSVGHLADSRRVGVVGHRHGDAQTVINQLSERHDALPWKIGGIFDIAAVEIGIRRTDADAGNQLRPAHRIHQPFQSQGHGVDVIIDFHIFPCFYGRGGHDLSPSIDNSHHGIGSSYVYADGIRFAMIHT